MFPKIKPKIVAVFIQTDDESFGTENSTRNKQRSFNRLRVRGCKVMIVDIGFHHFSDSCKDRIYFQITVDGY